MECVYGVFKKINSISFYYRKFLSNSSGKILQLQTPAILTT